MYMYMSHMYMLQIAGSALQLLLSGGSAGLEAIELLGDRLLGQLGGDRRSLGLGHLHHTQCIHPKSAWNARTCTCGGRMHALCELLSPHQAVMYMYMLHIYIHVTHQAVGGGVDLARLGPCGRGDRGGLGIAIAEQRLGLHVHGNAHMGRSGLMSMRVSHRAHGWWVRS